MNMKRILLVLVIAFAVIVSLSAVSAGLFDGLLGQSQDNVIEISNITFNTTNVTQFKLFNKTGDAGECAEWYVDENDSGYNVQIYNLSAIDESDYNEWFMEYLNELGNISSQKIDGVVVYNTTATLGDNIGDARYGAYVENKDLKTVVDICTPNPDETVKIASTLKFK